MNIIKAGYELVPDTSDKLGIVKKIERVARNCYKSEELITDTSCIKMVQSLIKRGHYAMLEFGSFVFEIDTTSYYDTIALVNHLQDLVEQYKYEAFKSYLRFSDDNSKYIISGNVRAWLEFLEACMKYVGKIPVFLKIYFDAMSKLYNESDVTILFKNYIDAPEGFYIYEQAMVKVKRITPFEFKESLTIRERLIHQDLTVKFTVDRGIANELERHRECSFAQESTRYCNYSKGKFGNEITVIKPCYWEEDDEVFTEWKLSCEEAEKSYRILLNEGASPQQARSVLPLAIKADTYVNANIREWIHIFELRALGVTGKPHPQMEEVMIPLAKELVTGILSDFTCIESMNKVLTL